MVRPGALTEGLDPWEHESAKLSLYRKRLSATAMAAICAAS